MQANLNSRLKDEALLNKGMTFCLGGALSAPPKQKVMPKIKPELGYGEGSMGELELEELEQGDLLEREVSEDRVEKQSALNAALGEIAAMTRTVAQTQQGRSLELLALLRVLEGLHQEIRDSFFQEALPDNRQALYALLRDIELSGGWPYIHRMKLQALLVNLLSESELAQLASGSAPAPALANSEPATSEAEPSANPSESDPPPNGNFL
jgi:hypothetical protein